MTFNEAITVIQHMYIGSTFLHYPSGGFGCLDENEDKCDYHKVIDYLMGLDVSVEDAIKFVEGSIDFASMDNKRTGDDWDNLDIYEDGRIGCWTEVLGNVYYLDEMNKTFKDYEPSDEEIAEQQKRTEKWAKEFKEILRKSFETTKQLVTEDLVGLADLKKIKEDFD